MTKNRNIKRTQIKDLAAPEKELTAKEAGKLKGGAGKIAPSSEPVSEVNIDLNSSLPLLPQEPTEVFTPTKPRR
jgi:hypothetical protein